MATHVQDEGLSIVYFISTLEQAGAQVGLVRLLTGLDPEVYDIDVIAVKRGEHSVDTKIPDDFSVTVLEDQQLFRSPVLPNLWGTIRDADIMVCSLYHCAVIGRLVGAVARVPVILTWAHSESFKNGLRKAVRLGTASLSEAILADSPAVYETFVNDYTVPTSRIRMVPIAGIDTDEYAPKNTRTPTGELHVGTLGRLVPEKNYGQVLKTAATLGKRDTDLRYIFNIGGTGPLEDKLRSLRDKWELDNVRFHGFIEDAPAFMNANDVYFQPSHQEGLCITVLEAMACGLPVVGSATGGIETSVEHGTTGYLADPVDTDEFSTYIERLSDFDRRQTFGTLGRKRVREQYSQRTLINAFEAVLEEFTESERPDRLSAAQTR